MFSKNKFIIITLVIALIFTVFTNCPVEVEEEKDEKIMRREFSYCSFKRSFSLPELVDYDKITATHKNGVLSIEIPKREEAKEKPARQIAIS